MAFAFCPRDGTRLVPTAIDGRDRPACPRCGFADFMHVQIGANAIVERAGAVLLVKLSYGPREGRWTLPGGLMEGDETPAEAAVRETHEETGFAIEVDGLVASYMREAAQRAAGWTPLVVLTYRAHIVGGELRAAPEEVTEAAWFDRDELPPLEELAWPSTIHGLDAWKAFERARA
ncbi:MAG: NUDIX domain-containing protein [Chloroflexi bacterium]|nr:NUDIX domain-containing protein [Chloroflexota bacterium]